MATVVMPNGCSTDGDVMKIDQQWSVWNLQLHFYFKISEIHRVYIYIYTVDDEFNGSAFPWWSHKKGNACKHFKLCSSYLAVTESVHKSKKKKKLCSPLIQPLQVCQSVTFLPCWVCILPFPAVEWPLWPCALTTAPRVLSLGCLREKKKKRKSRMENKNPPTIVLKLFSVSHCCFSFSLSHLPSHRKPNRAGGSHYRLPSATLDWLLRSILALSGWSGCSVVLIVDTGWQPLI